MVALGSLSLDAAAQQATTAPSAADGALPAPPAADGGELVNGVVLRVNERILTYYDYLKARADLRDDILRRGEQLSSDEQARLLSEVPRQTMFSLFQEMLLLSRADQLEIFVSDADIDAEISRLRRDMGINSTTEFLQALEQTGLTMEELRLSLEKSVRSSRVIGTEVSPEVEVNDEDLRRYYRSHPEEFRVPARVEAQEVVVLESAVADAEERQRLAADLQQRVAAGESFFDAVDAVEALQEGDQLSSVIELGWVERGDLDPVLEEGVWSLSSSSVSEGIEARGGAHVVQVLNREEESLRPFSEVSEAIRQRERSRIFNEKYEAYLEDLERNAFVVENVPADALGFRRSLTSEPVVREPFKIQGEDGPAPAGDGR